MKKSPNQKQLSLVKIAKRTVAITEETGIQLCQSYKRTIKDLLLAQRFRSHPKNLKRANRAAKKLKTIAGRLVRDVERKLPDHLSQDYVNDLALFHRVLKQERTTKEKIYSLHEPQVYCIEFL